MDTANRLSQSGAPARCGRNLVAKPGFTGPISGRRRVCRQFAQGRDYFIQVFQFFSCVGTLCSQRPHHLDYFDGRHLISLGMGVSPDRLPQIILLDLCVNHSRGHGHGRPVAVSTHPDPAGACSVGKFVVSRAGEAYDVRELEV